MSDGPPPAAPPRNRPTRNAGGPRSESFEDAVAALVGLGYSAAQAQEAVRRSLEAEPDLSLEQLVRRALARLSKATVAAR